MTHKVPLGGPPRNNSDGLPILLDGLDARAIGQTYMAKCPAHDDRTPSLSIALSVTGKLLVKCHAGCEQGRVIDRLGTMGLWAGGCSPARRAMKPSKPRLFRPHAQLALAALRIWGACSPAEGTLVEKYLESRNCPLPEKDALRFHPALRHPSGGKWPAMVALVTRGTDGMTCAIHRTFLAYDGTGKAPVHPAKMMLGPCGGGVVRLEPLTGKHVMVDEGIETCLAAMTMTGLPAWAALSTAGLGTLTLPQNVTELTILADGDAPGEKAAIACASRVFSTVRVRIARAPVGMDFADMLLREAR